MDLQLVSLPGPPPTMKNHRVFEVFHKRHLKSHFLTCNFLMCLFDIWLYLVREERFPHGFIAFSLSVFLGVSRWPPRAIFNDFGRPLGASWALFGSPWAPLGLPWGLVATLLGPLEATK